MKRYCTRLGGDPRVRCCWPSESRPGTADQARRAQQLQDFPGVPRAATRRAWSSRSRKSTRREVCLGRPLELVVRDDTGNPGDAVRVAEELITREKVDLLMGTFSSAVGLAVADLARQRKVLFLASEPLTDKIVWENGNRYTFRLTAVDLHADGDAGPDCVRARTSGAGRSSTRITSTASRRLRRSSSR